MIEPVTNMRIGISSCLLGERVRYDGKHKRHSVIVDDLLPYVEVISVCPELELGMGVPRPPLKLAKDDSGDIRMITWQGERIDFTDPMNKFAASACGTRLSGISGYIFKSRSPSCGAGDVPIFDTGGDEVRDQSFGLYAATIRRWWPSLPVTDETHLSSRKHIRHFLERAYVYQCWQRNHTNPTEHFLNFHRKFRAHAISRNRDAESELDQITSQYRQSSSATDAEKYIGLLMDSLETLPTDSGHAAAIRYELDRTLPSDSVHLMSSLERSLMEFRIGSIDRNTLDRRLNVERIGQIAIPVICGGAFWNCRNY